MKTVYTQIILAALLLLQSQGAFAFGKKLQPIPNANNKVDVNFFYNAIATTNGLPGGCVLNRDPIDTSILPDGAMANFTIDSANSQGRFDIYNDASEYSDQTTDGVRVVRIGQYQERSLDGAWPSYEKDILLIKLKNNSIISLKAWNLISLYGPTQNDVEPTDPKAPGVLICE